MERVWRMSRWIFTSVSIQGLNLLINSSGFAFILNTPSTKCQAASSYLTNPWVMPGRHELWKNQRCSSVACHVVNRICKAILVVKAVRKLSPETSCAKTHLPKAQIAVPCKVATQIPARLPVGVHSSSRAMHNSKSWNSKESKRESRA